MNLRRQLPLLCATLTLAACANFDTVPEKKKTPRVVPAQQPVSGPYTMEHDAAPLPQDIPADLVNIPDAVPKPEPKSRSGNRPSYTVFGERYQVLDSAENYRETGGASWYGRKFHGNKTASGERYDMFAMTAAHKTLPLPSYVRVTREDTGKSVIVKINDRGPFHSKRIIDLSYAAAAKLDIIKRGAVTVLVENISFEPAGATQVASAPLEPTATPRGWLQVAAYPDPVNAIGLREDLNGAGLSPVEIWSGSKNTGALHRVLIGPFLNEIASQLAKEKLLARGLAADWVHE